MPKLVGLLIFVMVIGLIAGIGSIGDSRNDDIESIVKRSQKDALEGRYSDAEKELNKALDKFGPIYSIYMITLSEGDQYFIKDAITGRLGMIQLFHIAEDMAQGNADVKERLVQAENNLKKFKSYNCKKENMQSYNLGKKLVDSLEDLIPLVELVNQGEFDKVTRKISGEGLRGKNSSNPFGFLVTCSLLCEIAKAKKSIALLNKVILSVDTGYRKTGLKGYERLSRKANKLKDSWKASAKQNNETENSFKADYQRGLAFAKKGKFEKAQEFLKKSYAQKPENNTICYTLALVFKNLDKESEAKSLCKEIISRDEDHAKARKLLSALKN